MNDRFKSDIMELISQLESFAIEDTNADEVMHIYASDIYKIDYDTKKVNRLINS